MSIETMTKLSTVTVGAGGSATINFTNIPQTYTDLKLVISARTNVDNWNDNSIVRFNSDSGNSYSNRRVNASGSTVESSSNTLQDGFYYLNFNGSTATSNTFCNNEMYIPNYTSGNQKSFSIERVVENNVSAENLVSLIAGIWTGTAAITSISIAPYYGTLFSQHSTATLYGIKNARRTAGNSVKAIGGNISFDGTYVVHTFNSSGTFTPTAALTADYLVVAGGGGAGQTSGGGWQGGPGGAGGYRSFVSQSLLPNSAITITVGAGGTGGAYAAGGGNQGANGSNSSFGSTSSTGGGGGGTTGTNGKTKTSGKSGGSGGGSAQDTTSNTGGAGNAGGYTPVEGYAGGNVNGNTPYVPGQGGGSSGAGSQINAAATNGTANSISGSSVTYATGGSSGSFGNANATPNTGNGGNANTSGSSGGGDAPGWNGGSGVVIIRYKA
jgi:hypothetical protein